MLYNLKEWLRHASKDALVKAANIHSVSNGITTPWQLRRMLWDAYTWNYGDSNSLEVARYLSACIGEQSTVIEHPEHGVLIVKTIEYDIKVALNRDFTWSPLEASHPSQEERLGEALVEDATLAAPQVHTWPNGMPKRQPPVLRVECQPGGIYGDDHHVEHVIDLPNKSCRCGSINLGQNPIVNGSVTVNGHARAAEVAKFTPVEPNPESLDDLSLEDLLGHYNSVDLRMRNNLTVATNFESQGDFVGAMEQARQAIDESNTRDMVLENIERRFEKHGWLISRIKDR